MLRTYCRVAADILAEQVARLMDGQSRPLTAWEISRGVGGRRRREVVTILEEMTADGRLARFRAGLNHYYAPPRAALTEEKPLAGTVLIDSLKGRRFNGETTRLQTVSG